MYFPFFFAFVFALFFCLFVLLRFSQLLVYHYQEIESRRNLVTCSVSWGACDSEFPAIFCRYKQQQRQQKVVS